MSRRLVAVLFLDIVGWTGLTERVDPEPLQLLLEQYYEICSAAVQEHGGDVEKYIGDAVMAVFGAATSREDDALCALRAAFAIGASVGRLPTPEATPLEIHCGIAAGEALITRSSLAGLRVVGDVVNLAARLQSTATAGQILVNETIAQLARPHFTIVPVSSLTLKGKAEPVPVLLAVGPAESADQAGAGLVDRTEERAQLHDAYRQVVRDGRARAVAVFGPLGIGKTRLIREVVTELGGDQAPTVVVGTCPFYGPNENYDALAQVLRALAAEVRARTLPVREQERIDAVLASLGEDGLPRTEVAEPGPGLEEVLWAARELLTAAATAGPVVVLWDNLGWAGRSLLQVIDELTTGLEHLPLLMICAGRPQATPDTSWVGGLHEPEMLEVSALTPADSAQLAALLAAASGSIEVEAHNFDLLDRVTTYSAGNPLFIQLMVESAAPGQLAGNVPPTIRAVVGAMIDRLPAAARELLGAASVIGASFSLRQLSLLGFPATDLAAPLAALADQQLIRAGATAGEYAFVQQPVHEIAYAGLDKERRLAWHRCLAEQDVSPAFHFEAVVRLLSDLRPADPERARSARDAAHALLADGTAALRQRDVLTAIDLLERAVSFAIDGQATCLAEAAVRLSDALLLCGEAQRALDVVGEDSLRFSDDQARWPCVVQRHLLAVRLGRPSEVTLEQLAAELEAHGADRLAWCRLEQLRMAVALRAGHYVAAEEATCAALGHARALGDVYEEDRLLVALCEVRQWSPTPLVDKLAGCAELADRFALDRFLLIPVLAARARSLVLTGDRPGARAALAEAASAVEQLQLTMGQVLIDQTAGLECSLSGEHARAERHFRAATDILHRAGAVRSALTMQVLAGRERLRQGRLAEAAAEIATLIERRAEMDVRGQLLCLSTAARLAATEGTVHPLLREVLPLLIDTDDPCMRGEVYFDLAEAYRQLGDHSAAAGMAAEAIDNYAIVGASTPIRLVRAWM